MNYAAVQTALLQLCRDFILLSVQLQKKIVWKVNDEDSILSSMAFFMSCCWPN